MPTPRLQDGGAIVRVGRTTAAIAFDGATLDDWDDDELLEGRRKNKNGIFTGRRPKWLPAEMVRELTKRRLGRAHALLSHSTLDAVSLLRAVVNDESADTQHRLKAAETILNRVMGMPRESVDITTDVPLWQRLAAEAIRSMDDLKHHQGIVPTDEDAAIVDHGEVVEEPEPEREPVDPDGDAEE